MSDIILSADEERAEDYKRVNPKDQPLKYLHQDGSVTESQSVSITGSVLPEGAATEINQEIQITNQEAQITNQNTQIANQDEIIGLLSSLQDMYNAVMAIAGAKGVANDLRTTILSGTVTTVGTVNTLSNMTNFNGWATTMIPMQMFNSNAVLANINNVQG